MIGPPHTQVAYGPNRTVDANYFSFAYTRLQEQDWAEFFIHAKKKHVDAALGWMGYWYQGAGFRNPDAGWGPGLAYISLDTDAEVAGLNTNIRGTAGAWWPSFGYMEVYDTYTLGRFRQMGGQLQWTLPGIFNPDTTWCSPVVSAPRATVASTTARRRSSAASSASICSPTGTSRSNSATYVDVGLHYNTEWTADPNLAQGSTPGANRTGSVQAAHLTVLGGQLTVHAPMLGRLWLSPSIISVRNGWALASAGTEVMHSLGGVGVATNYLAWTGSPTAPPAAGGCSTLASSTRTRSPRSWDTRRE